MEDLYDTRVQYPSIKAEIEAFAETYSFNIESLLFQQLNKEQQELWKKEIEQACISGGDVGVELARDIRYRENVEVKKMDPDELSKELDKAVEIYKPTGNFGWGTLYNIAWHFYELGLKTKQNG